MYIIFNNNTKKYSCSVSATENEIHITFDDEFDIETEGFKCYSDDGNLIGEYDDYTIVKQYFDDGVVFTTSDLHEEVKEEKKLSEKVSELTDEVRRLKEAFNNIQNVVDELLLNMKEEES